mmetsp:Transcript_1775/g.2643  ORF Transcript_1775/g.2643 Transcript_1775/m.2643 type:complete len:315 (+) Transcript_1775:47-991(+)
MNPLSSTKSSWTGDGSDGSVELEGQTIRVLAHDQGTPFNALLDAPITSSNCYFSVEISEMEGSLGMGVVKKEEFLPGWKTKGMFYNGNLTNGSAGLLIGFGKRPEVGDKVGVYVQRELEGSVLVTFYINDRCLGPAFRLTDVNSDQIFYPCIHVSGRAVLEYSAPEAFPVVITRQPAAHSDIYMGEWKLTQAFTGPELGEFPLPKDSDIILTLESGDCSKNYELTAKVANVLRTNLNVVGKSDAFDRIEVGHVMSTMMMPSPELAAVEKYLLSSMSTLFKMIVSPESDRLIMTGATAELNCQRYSRAFEPLTQY